MKHAVRERRLVFLMKMTRGGGVLSHHLPPGIPSQSQPWRLRPEGQRLSEGDTLACGPLKDRDRTFIRTMLAFLIVLLSITFNKSFVKLAMQLK